MVTPDLRRLYGIDLASPDVGYLVIHYWVRWGCRDPYRKSIPEVQRNFCNVLYRLPGEVCAAFAS